MDLLLIAVVAFGASLLTLYSGFGLGTLLMPAFALFAPVPLAIAATAVVHLANNLFKGALLARHADRGVLLRFLPTAVPAAFAGGGLALGPPAGELLLQATDFGVVWAFAAAAPLLGALIAWRGVPETLSKQTPPSPPNPGGDVSSPEIGGMGGRPWRLPGQLRGLMGIALLTSSASALLAPILMIYLRDHVTPNLFGLATAYLPAAFASAFLPSRLGRLSDRYGRRLPIAIALRVGAVVSTFIPQVRSLWPLALLWVLEAAAFAAATPAQEALVVDIAGAAQRGTAFGYYTAAASLGAVIGPLLGGWIYDTFTAVWAFRANALMLGLGAVLILLVVRPAGEPDTDGNG